MRIAFFSDIHGNLPALEAALADAKQRAATHLICLGDIVGYGPQPIECLHRIRQVASGSLLGNHDAAVCGLFDKHRFNDFAKETADRVMMILSDEDCQWLQGLPYQIEGDGFICAHGSFNDPEAFDYLSERSDAALSFSLYPEHSLFFVGHTHIPCVFADDGVPNTLPRKLPAEDFTLQEGMRYIVNPGSIGFPRSDWLTADYVLFDTVTRRVSFHSVNYDMAPYRIALVNNGYNLLNYWFLSPKASQRRTELAMRAIKPRSISIDTVSGFAPSRASSTIVLYKVFYAIVMLLILAVAIVLGLLVYKNYATPPRQPEAASEDIATPPAESPFGNASQWRLTPEGACSFTLDDDTLILSRKGLETPSFALESPRLPLEQFGALSQQYQISYLLESPGRINYQIRCTYYRKDGTFVKGDPHRYTTDKPVQFMDKKKKDVVAVVITIDGILYDTLTFNHFQIQPEKN